VHGTAGPRPRLRRTSIDLCSSKAGFGCGFRLNYQHPLRELVPATCRSLPVVLLLAEAAIEALCWGSTSSNRFPTQPHQPPPDHDIRRLHDVLATLEHCPDHVFAVHTPCSQQIGTMPAGELSDKAVHGFAKAALYDQHRPSYPSGALASLLDAAQIGGVEGADLVDLGAGTGKFTEALAARAEHYNIVAVEPHPGMREQLAHKSLNNVTVLEGSSTAIPADSGSVDAVFAAQVRICACFASSCRWW
jgi:hypothetical protein